MFAEERQEKLLGILGKNAKWLFLRCVTSLMYLAPPFVPISDSWKRRAATRTHGGAVLRIAGKL